MNAKYVIWSLLGLGLVCGVIFLVVVVETAGPKLHTGAAVTTNGYVSLITSFLGMAGFTLSGVVTAILHRLGVQIPTPTGTVTDQNIAELAELTASFASLMKNKLNLAARRRFVFALADAAKLIGIDVTHENGVLVIRYSGFVEQTIATEAKPTSVAA